jgi:hypothetical protein
MKKVNTRQTRHTRIDIHYLQMNLELLGCCLRRHIVYTYVRSYYREYVGKSWAITTTTVTPSMKIKQGESSSVKYRGGESQYSQRQKKGIQQVLAAFHNWADKLDTINERWISAYHDQSRDFQTSPHLVSNILDSHHNEL